MEQRSVCVWAGGLMEEEGIGSSAPALPQLSVFPWEDARLPAPLPLAPQLPSFPDPLWP